MQQLAFDGSADSGIDRSIALEVPIALDYCGIGYAVMMASPDHLDEFAIGHAVAEGLVSSTKDVTDLNVTQLDGGWIVRAQLPQSARDAIFARARTRVSDSSCGLCGVESIAEALRPLAACHREDQNQPKSSGKGFGRSAQSSAAGPRNRRGSFCRVLRTGWRHPNGPRRCRSA